MKDTSPDERIKIEKKIVDEIDKIIATSPQEKKDLINLYKAERKKITVIPPGVNLRRFTPLDKEKARGKLNIPKNKKIVVFAGKMERRKGGTTIIAAAKEIKEKWPKIYQDLEVLMFSGDPRKTRTKEEKEAQDRHSLKDFIVENDVQDKVKLMPGVNQDILHQYYGAADVVVMPSYYEPFGMVAIEAMATGTPVVASNVGGLKWSIKEGKTGFHAKVKDHKDFAEKIVKVLKEPQLRDFLGKNGIVRVKNNFSWARIAEKMSNIYQGTIEKHNGLEDFEINNGLK